MNYGFKLRSTIIAASNTSIGFLMAARGQQAWADNVDVQTQ
jgi:hypothetical protein